MKESDHIAEELEGALDRAMRYCRVKTVAELYALKVSDPTGHGMSLLEWAKDVKPGVFDDDPPFM